MDEVTCCHTEFSDDNVVLDSNENLQELASKVSVEGNKVTCDLCDKWNMEIDALKHKLSIVSPPNMDVPDVNINVKGQDLEIVKEKKLLGIIIDNDLKLNSHITTRTNQAFKALKGIEHLCLQ